MDQVCNPNYAGASNIVDPNFPGDMVYYGMYRMCKSILFVFSLRLNLQAVFISLLCKSVSRSRTLTLGSGHISLRHLLVAVGLRPPHPFRSTSYTRNGTAKSQILSLSFG